MSKSCNKCPNTAIIVIGTNGYFCKDCFEKYFSHKFRAALGRNPVVRHGEKVAVAFSGGNNSRTMLHLLLEAMSPNAFKKLKFHPGIIFVDETAILKGDGFTAKLSMIQEIMNKSGLPHHTVKLEEVFKSCGSLAGRISGHNCDTDKLKGLFNSISTITAKEELLYRLRCKLLCHKAKELGYKHVFLGETSSRLAVNILSKIAQGRGAHIPMDTGFSDGGCIEGVNLLRPLRDISSKEIAVYIAIHKVTTVFMPTLSTKMATNASIQRLTETFISSLSADFPATETTVYRTANKLQTMSKAGKSEKECEQTQEFGQGNTLDEKCMLCNGLLDTNLHKDRAIAQEAMKFSHMLCAGDFGNPDAPAFSGHLSTLQPSSKDVDESVNIRADSEVNVVNLCHACQVLRMDVKEKDAAIDFNDAFSELLTPAKKLSEKEIEKSIGDLLISS